MRTQRLERGEKALRATPSALFSRQPYVKFPILGPSVSVSFDHQFRCRVTKVTSAVMAPIRLGTSMLTLSNSRGIAMRTPDAVRPATHHKPCFCRPFIGGDLLKKLHERDDFTRTSCIASTNHTGSYLRSVSKQDSHNSYDILCRMLGLYI